MFLVLILMILSLVWIAALIDALRHPRATWERAGHNQIVWVLVILLGHLIGAVIYAVVARPQLEAARVS